MKRDMERSKNLSRRALVLGGLHAAMFGVLGGRLAWLQVVEEDRYRTLSDKNRISMRLLPAGRGEIVDRFGVPVAVNTQNFRVFLTPEQAGDIEETLRRLGEFIPLSLAEKEEVMVEVERQRQFTPVMVKENLSWEQMARVEVNLPELPGISINEGKIRTYPLAEATAHIVGYVGLVSKTELTGDPVMNLPGFRIGKTGVEKQYDEVLRGVAGTVQAEVNAVGREIRELSRAEGRDGERLTLTVDAELQMRCQERLAEHKSAAAVIMDAHTGEVYALASHPGFDPNLFTRGISAEQWEELLSNPAVPLTNKAIAGQYPPGSTFKMITALAALEDGVIDPSHTVHCPGYHEIGTDRFHCWKRGGHGWVGMTAALEQSCDVFFYDIARKVGIDKIAETARVFGLGGKPALDLPGVAPGLMPDKAWKLGHFGRKWQIGETVVAGIGQGYVQATPLQLAVMTARLVNGGKAVEPSILRRVGAELRVRHDWPSMGIQDSYLKLMHRGMVAVTEGAKGTAQESQIETESMKMAGKTGTAQVKRISAKMRAEGVKNEDLPWKYRHHALFVGYAPLHKPRYVCSVIVEHGGGGSAVAAPVARDLLQAAQERDPAGKSRGASAATRGGDKG